MRDLRLALRTMRRNPAFAAIAVLSMALGIGANTAIFSVMYQVMLQRLPVAHPGQLVELLHRLPREGHRGNSFTRTAWQDLRAHNHVLSALTAASPASFTIRGAALAPEKVDGSYVAGSYFAVLGIQPVMGRLTAPEDDRPDTPAAAVLSWAYWNGRLRADRSILGRQIQIDNAPVSIIGIAPRGFVGWHSGARQDIWLPLVLAPPDARVQLVGRLKPGVSVAEAHAELAVLDRRLILEEAKTGTNPYTREVVLDLEPAGAGLTSPIREAFAKPLEALMALVGLLLLVACTNVASLLLAHGADRDAEIAVRVSLGAGRMRLLRQVLTESLAMALAGALAGVLLAYAATRILLDIALSGRYRMELHATPDVTVLLITVSAALLTGSLAGIAPAWRASTNNPNTALRGARPSGRTRFGRIFGKSLVVGQVGLSLVLLTTAWLFVSRLANLENTDMGFERDHVLLVTLDPARSGYQGERLSRAYEDLLARLSELPGVRSASLSAVTPLSGAGAARNATVEGYPAAPGENRLLAVNWTAPRYFLTLGIPMLAGRDFIPQDRGGPQVAIINQTMARYYFGAASPLGWHVAFDGDPQPYEIVGVVGDSNYQEIGEKTWRTIYLDTFQKGQPGSQLSVRTSERPAAIARAVRAMVATALPDVPIARLTTLADQVDASIIPERLTAFLSALFAVLGALLAAIGLYGLLACTVARRTHEIGIRMALGAPASRITRMVISDALGTVAAGLAVGLPLAAWARRFAAGLIRDLPVAATVPALAAACAMIAITLVAAYEPARRAARIDPMEALHQE